MAVTSGFFNSKNHDRRYSNIEVSSMFDGVIHDGVFQTIGNHFQVSATTGRIINVDTGKAWFNHTWTVNDSKLPLSVDQSEVVMNRIDAVVIEVNTEENIRSNSIRIVKGVPATKPVKPTLAKTNTVIQHPLAYITVTGGSTAILQSDIENVVGLDVCPYVKAVNESVSMESLVIQWQAQWSKWYTENTRANEHKYNDWFQSMQHILSGSSAAEIINKLSQLGAALTNIPTKLSQLSNDKRYRAKSYESVVTLSRTGWSGKSYTVSNSKVTPSSDIFITPVKISNIPSDNDRAYMKLYQKVNFAPGEISSGRFTLIAMGAVPTDDFRINVVVYND